MLQQHEAGQALCQHAEVFGSGGMSEPEALQHPGHIFDLGQNVSDGLHAVRRAPQHVNGVLPLPNDLWQGDTQSLAVHMLRMVAWPGNCSSAEQVVNFACLSHCLK